MQRSFPWPPDAVLFDNDGTVVDTQELILASFRHATRVVLGRQLPDAAIMDSSGIPLDRQMLDIADTPAQAAELSRVYREYNATVHDDMIAAFDGVSELLEWLDERGVPLAVVTSKLRGVCAHGLETVGLASRFRFVIGSDDCPAHKPAPDPLLLACERLGARPERTLYVGDSPFDMQAARAASMMGVAALWGMFTRDQLAAASQPDAWAARPSDVLALMKTAGGQEG
ncbi:HAD-IA family hydrolase [Berryella wangjianweii]|uniref:Tyrosine-protein kinase PtkA n=1 Tax=Berryella wangjianweii TaxID=2734634 RepID=A0A6M8J5C4_9ACTN|nr:HAD-IA family hydrolase [Berryella wangjianweii]QKF07176.1 HAD-IA family hydrolase [Berryella wangjianweii]